MRMDEVGFLFANDLRHALRRLRHEAHFAGERYLRPHRGNHGRAVEVPAFDGLLVSLTAILLWRSQLKRFPPDGPLLAQDCKRPERITALQRNRMIEDVEDAHFRPPNAAAEAIRQSERPRVSRQHSRGMPGT